MAGLTLKNHPELVSSWETYGAIADLMTNDVKRVHKYLLPHVSEIDLPGPKYFQNRLERLIRINKTKPYLDILCIHMSQPLKVGGAENERLKIIEKDVTGFRECLSGIP